MACLLERKQNFDLIKTQFAEAFGHIKVRFVTEKDKESSLKFPIKQGNLFAFTMKTYNVTQD